MSKKTEFQNWSEVNGGVGQLVEKHLSIIDAAS